MSTFAVKADKIPFAQSASGPGYLLVRRRVFGHFIRSQTARLLTALWFLGWHLAGDTRLAASLDHDIMDWPISASLGVPGLLSNSCN